MASSQGIIKVNLESAFDKISEYWTPKIIGELNQQHVKIVKCHNSFTWHSHENEDELFLVIKGRLKMEFRSHSEFLGPGEMIIVPRGVEHCPQTDDEAFVLLFEPAGTVNTGDNPGDLTHPNPKWI